MKKIVSAIVVSAMLFSVLFLIHTSVVAKGNDDKNRFPEAVVYEIDPDNKFESKSKDKISGKTAYGKNSIGSLMVSGEIFSDAEYNDLLAYSVKGDIKIRYIYKSEYEIKTSATDWVDNEDTWFMVSDKAKNIDGYDAKGKIKSGCVMALSSKDGMNYEVIGDPKKDFFANYSSSQNELCSFTADDLKNGVYVKIIVAYRMKLRTEDNLIKDEYEEYKYLEIYDFYLSYEKFPIIIRDMDNRIDLSDNAKVSRGFIVDFSGYAGTVDVEKPSGTKVTAIDSQTFCEPGKYTISAQTSMGTEISQTVEVVQGLKYSVVNPDVYQLEDETGYVEKNANMLSSGEKTVFGTKSHTTIKIGSECIVKEKNGFKAYGTKGEDLYLYLSYNQNETDSYNGWKFSDDDWGKLTSQTVTAENIATGEIGSGAIIVKTSDDGKNWTDYSKNSLANGIYNTNVSESYGTAGNIAIYLPSGEDVINGKYFKIYYVYEVENRKQVKNYLEKYEFYICYDDLDAITIHNLSITDDMLDPYLDSDSQSDIEMYRMSETMRNNDYTVSGFTIDKTILPGIDINATLTVKRNGEEINIPKSMTFTEDGRYEIDIVSDLGTKRCVTIYVDKSTNEEALKYYFGESFIDVDSKRIFSNDVYPVFEGGHAYYNLNEVDENHKKLTGTITNITTGSIVTIDTNEETHELLTEPGIYYAELSTDNKYDSIKSGDSRRFMFYFEIKEEGTAPGPVINQDTLKEFSTKTISDAKMVYYGITVPSASVGNVVLLYDSYDEALKASIEFERGNIVSDGNVYSYAPVNRPDIKQYYSSYEEAESYADYYAQLAVERRYIDFTNPSTLYTLKDEDILPNVRDLHIAFDVYLFGENQRELMVKTDSYPLINNKKAFFVDPDGLEKKAVPSDYSYVFVQDKYEIDSSSVTISDSEGKNTIQIEYGKSVQEQLEAADYSTGVISIHEQTKYGDEATYNAFYVAPGENTTTYTIVYEVDGNEYKIDVSQNNIPNYTVEAEFFYLDSISDDVDPYGLIKVTQSNGDEFFCMPSETMEDRWTVPGEYTITCVNRLGYSYSYTLRVISSNDVIVSFVNEDYTVMESYVLEVGNTDIELPKYERKGYTLDGFINIDTQEKLGETLGTIDKSGQYYFKPVWIPIKIDMVYYDELDREIQTKEVEFGGTYELKDYESNNDMEFIGWTTGGVKIVEDSIDDINLFSGSITIDTDENLYLYPVFKKEETESDVEETIVTEPVITSESTEPTITVSESVQPSEKKSKTGPVIAIVGIATLSAAIVAVCFFIVKKENNSRG